MGCQFVANKASKALCCTMIWLNKSSLHILGVRRRKTEQEHCVVLTKDKPGFTAGLPNDGAGGEQAFLTKV